MITPEMVEAQRELYSKPIIIGDVAIKVLTVRNRHFGILDGVTIPSKTMVEIYPGFAFGDGTHPTTQMCLKAIQKHLKPGASMLDIGCGCGILSIVSLLLGVDHAHGVDIDPMCVEVAKGNAERNNVAQRFTASVGDLTGGISGKFDVITANILADPVIRLLDGLHTFVKEDSTVILSGIYENREAEVIEAAENHFTIIERQMEDNWLCLVLKTKQ